MLVIARLEHVVLVYVVFVVVLVTAIAIRQDRAHDITPEPRERDARGLHHTTDRLEAVPDRVQHVAHAQRRRDHDGDDETDEREQGGTRGADHRARDLGEVLADCATRTVTGDAVVGRDQVHERGEREHADRRTDRDRRRHHAVAIEQHAHGRDRTEQDEAVPGDAGDPVEESRDRTPERAHHQRARLKRHHRDQEEQRGAKTNDPGHLAAAVMDSARPRSAVNFWVFGHRCSVEHVILHGITSTPKF